MKHIFLVAGLASFFALGACDLGSDKGDAKSRTTVEESVDKPGATPAEVKKETTTEVDKESE